MTPVATIAEHISNCTAAALSRSTWTPHYDLMRRLEKGAASCHELGSYVVIITIDSGELIALTVKECLDPLLTRKHGVQERGSLGAPSWKPHYNKIQEIEKECRLHSEIVAYTIRICVGLNGGVRQLLIEKDRNWSRVTK